MRFPAMPLISGFAFCWLSAAWAQSPDPAEAAGDQASGEELSAAQIAAGPIEEVIVTGQRTYSALIREGARLTEEFYARLNTVIDDEDFRIRCDSEFPTGSSIPQRVCRTAFQRRLLNQQSVSIIPGLGSTEDGLPTFNDSVMEIRPQMVQWMQDFEEAILLAVNTDPELNAQVIRLLALKSAVETFETPRERRQRERAERREARRDD